MSNSANQLFSRSQERRPFQPFGAGLTAWKSRRRELVLAGPANTGKSRTILEKLHYCVDRYPGARALIVRKTRASLMQTALVTYERKVLPEGWLGELIHFSTVAQQYEYPNGSIIAIGGLDKSTKIMSSDYDLIYPQEATELTLDDWEALSSRLRNHVMPYQQLLGDCNPGPPTHWLKVRAMSGRLLMLDSKHEDNPACTPEDIATLDALTGVRYLRLRLGIWAAAEGLVYDTWNPAEHVLSLAQLQKLGVFQEDGSVNREVIRKCIAGVDWGWTNPGVIQIWGVDADERMYLLREIYRVQQTNQWWVQQALELDREYRIDQWFCDPSEPAFIANFQAAGLAAVKAENAIKPGISAVQARLKQAGDGRARLFLYNAALQERDELRVSKSQPFCLESEIGEYVWPKSKDGTAVQEVPVKVNDHAMDAARYAVMGLEQPMIPLLGEYAEQANSDVTQEILARTREHPPVVDPFSWATMHGLWEE